MDANAAPRAHLVIVDDEPVILQIFQAVFEDEPYRLTCASDGAGARAVLETGDFDLLITDKNLPDTSGLELLRLAKAHNPLCEVIIVTGYASLETALTALELDAYDYILKPLDNIFDIKKKVRLALGKQEMGRRNRQLLEDLKEKNEALEVALARTQALQAELIQSEKLAGIGTLAAGIAHEISSPLFGIMGLAEAIGDEPELSAAREYAAEIVDYSRGIRDIVVELSSYSRSSSHEYLTTVELARVVEDALRLVQRSAPVGEVVFELDLAEGVYVHARTNEVQQVFVNLIKNACDAAIERHGDGAQGRVRVSTGLSEGVAWATVSDNGAGIAEDRIGVVFDPFYTTKPPGKGTGLGLNVVYRILTKYRGTVRVQSTVGEGTSFRLEIPVQG